jgi:hypothetical protein
MEIFIKDQTGLLHQLTIIYIKEFTDNCVLSTNTITIQMQLDYV